MAMLIISGKVGSWVHIGNDIIVQVIRITRGREGHADSVRLGFDAPQDLRILRDKVYKKVQSELKDGE